MAKLKQYHWYTIRFYDHFISDKEKQIICRVDGQYLKSDDTYHHFTWWEVETEDLELYDNNLEKFSILKTAVIEFKPL